MTFPLMRQHISPRLIVSHRLHVITSSIRRTLLFPNLRPEPMLLWQKQLFFSPTRQTTENVRLSPFLGKYENQRPSLNVWGTIRLLVLNNSRLVSHQLRRLAPFHDWRQHRRHQWHSPSGLLEGIKAARE